MHLHQPFASCALVERVDVLGDEQETAAARHLPALDGGERTMGGVRLLLQHDVEPARVPRPASGRVLLEVTVRAELGDVALPHGAGVGAAEGRDAAREADPGAGDDGERTGADTLTGGSFVDLRVNFDDQDRPYLVGSRHDGTEVAVPGMSTGTADQLYLALRIGSVADYLDRADRLPFVADDLFINFDDDRAAAGIKVLGQLAARTQVLFFTHHKHLVDIARATLSESTPVVELGAVTSA